MVIDALKSPPDSKVFTFGVIAVEEFCNRVEEWPSFCIALYKIPHLHNTSYKSFELIRNIVSLSAKSIQGGSDSAGSAASVQSAPQDLARPSGGADTTHKRPFTSLDPSPPPSAPGVEFSDPSEDVQDKIQFAVNNLAQSNLEEKLAEVKESLKESYYVWFSQTVLVKRASQEPNYHALYLKFLDLLNSSLLTRCILHDTYLNIQRLLNAKTTISSSQDRLQLKNLGSWLGGLTLARDVPILRVNVSFKALLMEGHESGLLVVAIPFVCKVLEQCAKSTVFQPPNPWLMGIIKVLAELYRVADLKLNLKFEIEVLCKALKVDFASISPSNLLLSNAQEAANALAQDLARADMLGKTPEAPQPMAAVGATAAASGAIRMATPGTYMHIITLTSDDITVDIFSVLAQHTQFAETSEIFQTHPALKNKYFLVVGKAIRSIIPAHISRSVTVAVCCTRDTIVKDFCGDSDEEQMHRCAQIMARSMAGAMAVVLARDALKNALLREIFELLVANGMKEPIAEQASCALVASNLDLACAIAEKEAVERASVKIDEVLAPSYHSRKRTREHTGQPFYDMATYGRLMYPADFPDILKIKLSSLPPGVLRVYEDYAQIPHFLSQIVANPTGLAALGDGLRKGMYTPADRWSLQ
ncbi:CCR4-NOT core subunit cdc39, partial [Spiromyces aspiralis]